ncbi:MAG: TetR/AcrR family transcriptional regulator [Actinomycetota bacterium]
MDVKTRKEEQAEATRSLLISVARKLFTEKGYAETPIEEIAAGAGLTKGALYHHFKDKKQLFEAVFIQIEREINDHITAEQKRVRAPFQQLKAACHAYLDACLDNDVRQVVVLDAPSVLSWDRYCEIDQDYAIRTITTSLERVRDSGAKFEEPLDSLAYLVVGTLTMGGRVIARASNRKSARSDVGSTLDRVLAGVVGAKK